MDKQLIFKKFKKILVEVAVVVSILLGLWSVGRIVFHDISTMISGYEEIAIEYTEDDDWMGVTHEVVSKTVKRKVPFVEAFGEFITNVLTLIVCGGFWVILPAQETRKDMDY